jgi:hypothetical protein
MDRVLRADANIWVEGHDAIAAALELTLRYRVADAIVNHSLHLEQPGLGTSEKRLRLPMVVVAVGQRAKFNSSLITVAGCAQPVVRLSGLVTTAAVPAVEGFLLRERGNRDARNWLFVAGIDPLQVSALGLFYDPVVEQAGFISVPKEDARNLRKGILGFEA